MRIITLATALVSIGCAPHPTVPEDQLTHLPADAVERLVPLHARADALEERVHVTELELRRAEVDAIAQQERLQATEEALDAERRLRRLAVRRGDAEAARAAEERLEDHVSWLGRARAEVGDAMANYARTEADLELLRAELGLAEAEIELARAVGVASTEGVRIRPYERAVRRALQRREEAAEVRLGLTASVTGT